MQERNHHIMAVLKLLLHKVEALESKLQLILDACERLAAEDEYSVYTDSEEVSQHSAP